MKQFSAALFDLDGTLLDTREFVYQAFEHTLKTHKISKRSRQDFEKLMSRSIIEIYDNLAPGVNPSILLNTHNDFQMDNLDLIAAFPSTANVLRQLREKEMKIAVVTNRYFSARISLERAGIIDLIDFIVTAEDVTTVKPDPEGIFKALAHFGLTKNQAVMIGDSNVDVQAGKNAGVATIAVTYGFHGKNVSDHNPEFIVKDLKEILPIIFEEKGK